MQEIVGHCRAEGEHAAFAGGVGGHVGLAPAGAGANVDDRAAADPDHVRQHGATAQIRALQIDRHDAIERRLIGVQHRAQRADGRIVDQSVNSSMTLQRRLDDFGNVGRIRYVRLHQVGVQPALPQFGRKPGNRRRGRT